MNKLAWFSTENGRKFVFAGTTLGTTAIISLAYFPNTIFINKYQEIVQCYSEGIPRTTSDRVMKCFDRAVQMLSIPDQTRKLLKPFTVVGCDLFNAGSTYSRYGAIIGIPVNYGYINEDSVDKREIVVRQEPIDWESEDGKKLAKALVLTDEEKTFGIAREILTAQTGKKVLCMFYPPAAILFYYALTSSLNRRLRLFTRGLGLRAVMYTLAGVYTFGLWCFARDFTETYYEGYVDEMLADVSPAVALTGVSFYNKILERNSSLRTFIGDNSFTVYGNENFLLRQRRLPLTQRKEYFVKRYKEYCEAKQ